MPYNGETIDGRFYPAYQSIAFRFEPGFEPSTEQLAELKERVLKFPAAYAQQNPSKPALEITGFRLLQHETLQTTQRF
jgi:hypothetical protein